MGDMCHKCRNVKSITCPCCKKDVCYYHTKRRDDYGNLYSVGAIQNRAICVDCSEKLDLYLKHIRGYRERAEQEVAKLRDEFYRECKQEV